MLEFVTKVYLPADILYYKCNIVELLIVKLNLFSFLNTIVKFKNIWLHCEMIVVWTLIAVRCIILCVVILYIDVVIINKVDTKYYETIIWCYQEIKRMQGTMPGAYRRWRQSMAWMENIKTWTGGQDSPWKSQSEWHRKYVHGVAIPAIEDGWRTEQQEQTP